jgi:hypothetical protein
MTPGEPIFDVIIRLKVMYVMVAIFGAIVLVDLGVRLARWLIGRKRDEKGENEIRGAPPAP